MAGMGRKLPLGEAGICNSARQLRRYTPWCLLYRRATLSFDSTEECEVVLIPEGEIPELIHRGVISHALVVVAFHHLLLSQKM